MLLYARWDVGGWISFGSSFIPRFFSFWFYWIPHRCSPRAPRLIRSSIVPHDTRKARHPTWKSRAHSADGQDVSTSELNVQKCNDFPFCCTSFQPIRSILEDDRMSENSSFFSEVGSYSTESTSTNMESTGTDDNFDQIFGDTGICWNRLSRNSTDSDTASSSSSPSPLHSRHSPLTDFDYSSSECPETCCPCAESAVDRPGFWAGEGRGSLVCRKHFRKPVDSSSSSCREPGANKLGQNYDDMKFTSVSCSRRFTRERVDWTFRYKRYVSECNGIKSLRGGMLGSLCMYLKIHSLPSCWN